MLGTGILADLVAAVADGITEVLVLAETGVVTRRAAKGASDGVHVVNAGLLLSSQQVRRAGLDWCDELTTQVGS